MMTGPELLTIRISTSYAGHPRVLNDLELRVDAGEIVGLIGHSGSGKSTLALSILRLAHLKGAIVEGSIEFGGRDLMKATAREVRHVRGRDIGLVLQSPLSSLNPALKIRTQLAEAWSVHKKGTKHERQREIVNALNSASLPTGEEFLRRYPRELSVGQAQRVLIAMAILHRPAMLIADEPTSALDPITQSEILALFKNLNQTMGMAILYISHDLLSVASICDRIAILHEGRIVECRKTKDVLENPEHPYARRLIGALPLKVLRSIAESVDPAPTSGFGARVAARHMGQIGD